MGLGSGTAAPTSPPPQRDNVGISVVAMPAALRNALCSDLSDSPHDWRGVAHLDTDSAQETLGTSPVCTGDAGVLPV